MADLACEIEATRLLVYNAARLAEANQSFIKEAAIAKLYSSNVATKVTSKCVELLGGVGFTKEFPIEKFYRDCKIGKRKILNIKKILFLKEQYMRELQIFN